MTSRYIRKKFVVETTLYYGREIPPAAITFLPLSTLRPNDILILPSLKNKILIFSTERLASERIFIHYAVPPSSS